MEGWSQPRLLSFKGKSRWAAAVLLPAYPFLPAGHVWSSLIPAAPQLREPLCRQLPLHEMSLNSTLHVGREISNRTFSEASITAGAAGAHISIITS